MNLNGARKMHGACLIRLLSGKMPLNGKKKKLKGPLGTLQKTYLLTYYTLVGNVKKCHIFQNIMKSMCRERFLVVRMMTFLLLPTLKLEKKAFGW